MGLQRVGHDWVTESTHAVWHEPGQCHKATPVWQVVMERGVGNWDCASSRWYLSHLLTSHVAFGNNFFVSQFSCLWIYIVLTKSVYSVYVSFILVTYCCLANCPKMQCPKTTTICYFRDCANSNKYRWIAREDSGPQTMILLYSFLQTKNTNSKSIKIFFVIKGCKGSREARSEL